MLLHPGLPSACVSCLFLFGLPRPFSACTTRLFCAVVRWCAFVHLLSSPSTGILFFFLPRRAPAQCPVPTLCLFLSPRDSLCQSLLVFVQVSFWPVHFLVLSRTPRLLALPCLAFPTPSLGSKFLLASGPLVCRAPAAFVTTILYCTVAGVRLYRIRPVYGPSTDIYRIVS